MLKVFRFSTEILCDSCVLLLKALSCDIVELLCLILFFLSACNNFPFPAFVTMICWTSIEVLLNLVAPLDSAMPSLDFEQIEIFWTSEFDSVSILFYSLNVTRTIPQMQFPYLIWVFFLLNLSNSINGLWLWFHEHWTFSSYGLLIFSRRLSKSWCSLALHVLSFEFE